MNNLVLSDNQAMGVNWEREYFYLCCTTGVSRTTRTHVRHADDTGGAYHSKNEKPFANDCKSAKIELPSTEMVFTSA